MEWPKGARDVATNLIECILHEVCFVVFDGVIDLFVILAMHQVL